MNAIQRWDAAVAEVMAQRGLSLSKATREVVISQPNLHAEYLAEYSEQRSAGGRRNAILDRSPAAVPAHHDRQTAAGMPGSSGNFSDPIAEWDSALARLTASGLGKVEATRQLVTTNRELHAAYIAAYTAKFGDAVRHPGGGRTRMVAV